MSSLSNYWQRVKRNTGLNNLSDAQTALLATTAVGMTALGSLAYRYVKKFKSMDADFVTFGSKLNAKYFENRIIWITGASSGIGQALAYYIASLKVNAKLVLTARREEKLNQLKSDLIDTFGLANNKDDIYVLSMDLNERDLNYYRTKYQSILTYFNVNNIDILINNAGFSMRSTFADFDLKDAVDMIQVNLASHMILTKLVLDDIVKQCQNSENNDTFGHIIYTSSVAARLTPPTRTTYSATKVGLLGFTYSLSHELSMYKNIHVTAVLPGPVKTDVDVAARGKKGSKHDKRDVTIQSGMTPMRCAELTCIAASNGIREAWISTQPVLTAMYSSYYMPDTFQKKMKGFAKGLLKDAGY